MPLTTGAALAIGAGITAATTGASIGASAARNKKQQRWTQENMRLSSTLNKEAYDHQFNRQAAYYDPAHQRALYEKANLNPALMYSNGAGGSSISGSVASTPPVTPDVESVFDSSDAAAINQAVGNMTDLAYKSSLTEKADADTQFILSQIADPSPVKEGERATPGQVAYQMLLEDYNEKVYGNEIKKIEAEVARDTKGVRKEKIKLDLENMRQRLVNDTNLSQSMVSWYNLQAELFGAQKIDLEKTAPSRIAANEASAARDNAQASTAPSQIAANNASAARDNANAAQIEFDNKMQQTIGYRPGWNVWQMLAGVYQKAVYVGDYQNNVDDVSEEVENSVKTWFDKLSKDEQKIIKENLKSFIWQLK